MRPAEWQNITGEVAEARRRELATIQRKIDHIVEAIADGGRNAALRAKLDTLTSTYEALQAEAGEGDAHLPPLEADLAEIYHRRINDLQQALASDDAIESRERVRDLIDQIAVRPPEDEGEPVVEFSGNLASMLALGGLALAKEPSIKEGPGDSVPWPYLLPQPARKNRPMVRRMPMVVMAMRRAVSLMRRSI